MGPFRIEETFFLFYTKVWTIRVAFALRFQNVRYFSASFARPINLQKKRPSCVGVFAWGFPLGRTDPTETVQIIKKQSFLQTRRIVQKPSETQRFR